MKSPSISVVIPLFNKEPHIKRAIKSVLDQTTPPSEIIIVNDGSTDGGDRHIQEYTDCTLTLIHQENRGSSGARNRGIREARSALIAFLDADDEWKPEFLSTITRLHSKFPDAAAFGTAYIIVNNNSQISSPHVTNLPNGAWEGSIPNYFCTAFYDPPFSASNAVVRKSILDELGGFREGYKIGEDLDLWVRIALKYPIAYSNTVQAVYHQEVTSRASDGLFYAYNEIAFQDTIEHARQDPQIPAEIRIDMQDFLVRHQLFAVHHNLLAGNRDAAASILKSVAGTRRFRRELLWWRFWSRMPTKLFMLGREINQTFKRASRKQ